MSIRSVVIATLMCACAWSASAANKPFVPPIDPVRYEAADEDSGFIDEVSLNGPYVEINSVTYFFTDDAYIDVGGSRSAPTLLQRGMNVYVRFLMLDGRKRVIYLRQLPDNAPTMAR